MSALLCPSCGRENPEGFAFCGFCGAPLAAAAASREVRKTVTIVFSDVTGSTALGERLDPESLRRVMSRYFDAMRAVLERHGGTVEKFIGDAVMAVFGIPVLHEDDALRAVRAAAEMQQALAELNADLERERGVTIAVRTGVNTGEIVAGDPSAGQTLVTGDAVNTAARLEQAAAPGEILLGDATHRLVRDAVLVEPVAPLDLKGKAEPVPAHRLLEVLPETAGHARHLDSPMVGRERELTMIRESFDRVVSGRECHLFTLLGPAGVGKSRLVEEFLDGVRGRATVLRGRCLPYGEGITFYPVADVVRQALGDGDLAAALGAVLDDEERAPVVVQRLTAMLGGGDERQATTEEMFWALRTLLEGLAHRNPVVVVFDDIHWGEPTFLDLIDHVTDWSRDAPILLVCVARPELLDHRPAWGGGKLNAGSILLEPLSDDQAGQLIENLLGAVGLAPAARVRITQAAEGNPLFVEEMLGMLIDEGLLVHGDAEGWVPVADLSTVAIPPTIQALLAARLDRLDGSQRSVIERASVVGKEFWRGAVVELSPEPERPEVPANLMTLVRKELIRPGRSTLAGDDAFRFRHLLIRDAAYDSMSKEHRADLHERFAGWLERVAGDRVGEYDEILGYHLEQSVRYRRELGPVDDHTSAMAARAAERLAAAGERAIARGDKPATANLVGRAIRLLEPGSPTRTKLWPFLVEVIDIDDLAGQRRALDEGLAEARAAGDRATELRLEVLEVLHRSNSDPSLEQGRMAEVITRARHELDELGDEAGAAFASARLAQVEFWLGRAREAFVAVQSALEYARRTGDRRLEQQSLEFLFGPLTWGPFPVEETLRWAEEIRTVAGGHGIIEAYCLGLDAFLATLLGRFQVGRDLLAAALRILEDFGITLGVSMFAQVGVEIHKIAGDLDAAIVLGRRGVEDLQRMGETGYLSTSAGYLALVLVQWGQDEEAERMTELGERSAAADDFSSQELWRRARARILSRRGEHDLAESLAREAVRITSATDYTIEHADARMQLAEVLDAAGRPVEAAEEARVALALYEDKGATVLVERARAEVARLEAAAD